MQTNLLMNVLMMSPGGTGLTPPSNPLLGAQSAVIQSGNTIGEFAGLLGQPGKASDLALSQTNNPTGDIEAFPQALDIASLGLNGQNLPTLATYIDQQVTPAVKNPATLEPSAGDVVTASKKNIGETILANINKSKPTISSGATQVASDVVNEQEFQQALKNISEQKQPDGKIKLPELPADVKTQVTAENNADVQDLLTKVAANIAQPVTAEKKAETKTVTTATTANLVANTEATTADVTAKPAQAAAASNPENGELANKFKTDVTQIASKDALKDEKTFTIESTEGAAGTHRTHDIQGHIKEIKIEPKIDTAAIRSAADQVEVKIAQMVKDGVDMVRIKLHPEELGKIDIQMDVGDDGKTSIRIVADRVETLDMLRKDSNSLEKALKDTGVRTDAGSLQFSLRDQQQQQQNFAGNNGKQHYYNNAQVTDNYLKAANVNEYIMTLNPQKDGLNILA